MMTMLVVFIIVLCVCLEIVVTALSVCRFVYILHQDFMAKVENVVKKRWSRLRPCLVCPEYAQGILALSVQNFSACHLNSVHTNKPFCPIVSS